MGIDLDIELAAADPAARQHTSALVDELSRLIDETEKVDRVRHRRMARVGAAAVVAMTLGGAGAAAAATGLLEWDRTGWWSDDDATNRVVRSEAGQECRVAYAPRPVQEEGHPISVDDRAAAMAAAADFLRTFDYRALDGLSPAAAFDELDARLGQSLSRQGLSTHAVSVALATDCETRTKQ